MNPSVGGPERIVKGLREKAESMRRFRPSQYNPNQRKELALKAVLFDEAADEIEKLWAIGRKIVDARYGIVPLPDGVSGGEGDNELDNAIVELQTVLP